MGGQGRGGEDGRTGGGEGRGGEDGRTGEGKEGEGRGGTGGEGESIILSTFPPSKEKIELLLPRKRSLVRH